MDGVAVTLVCVSLLTKKRCNDLKSVFYESMYLLAS